MTKITKIFAVLMACFVCLFAFVGCANIAIKPPNKEAFDINSYEIIFEDNFSGNSLDSRYWRIFNGSRANVKDPDHIHRAAYVADDSDIVYVANDCLTIATKYKDGAYGKGWYTGWIESTPKEQAKRSMYSTADNFEGFATKYGYFEIRCKCPPAEGMWSAFWLMPAEGDGLTNGDTMGTATDGAEIDVMESQNYFRKKSFVQHVVHSDYGTGHGVKSDKSRIYKLNDMYNEFHTYGVEWTETKITFYIDGYKTYETENVVDGKVLGTPQIKESMILSVEIAGYADEDNNLHVGKEKDGSNSWLGSMDNMDKTKSYDFVIDYVKVMKKK